MRTDLQERKWQEIVNASRAVHGRSVDRSDWPTIKTPNDLKVYLESIVPIPVIECGSTALCAAYVILENGYRININGTVWRI